jgi:YVTN family beta-propeller protein
MKNKLFLLAIAGALLGVLVSCEKSESPTETPAPTSKAVYILNGLGSTISVLDLNTDAVANNVAQCGTYPNQVLYYDGKLFVVNSGSNNVQVRSADTYALLGTIDIGANNNPMNIAIVSAQKGYVTCSQSNTVKVVNLSTYTVTSTINAGVGTTGIIIASGKAYATNTAFNVSNFTYGQGTVTVINTTTDAVVTTLNVETNPQAAAVATDGKVHVVCTGDYGAAPGKVVVIDPATDAIVRTITVGGAPGNIAISGSNVAYLGLFGTGLITYNTQTYAIQDSSTNTLLKKAGSGTVIDASGNIYVADFANDQLVKMNSVHAVQKTYDVGDGPLSLSIK